MHRRTAILAAIGLPISAATGLRAGAQDRGSLEATIAALETQVALLPTETPTSQPPADALTLTLPNFTVTLLGVNVTTVEPGYHGIFADLETNSRWIIIELRIDNPGATRPFSPEFFSLRWKALVAREISANDFFDLPDRYLYGDDVPSGISTTFIVFNTSWLGELSELSLFDSRLSNSSSKLPLPDPPSPTSRLSQFELTVTATRLELDILGQYDTRYTSPDGAWLVVDATITNTGERTARFEIGSDLYVVEESGVVWPLYGSADWYFDDMVNFTGPISPGSPQSVTLLFSLVPEAAGITLRHLVYGVNTPLNNE